MCTRFCRLCMSTENLNPIFAIQEYYYKYSHVIFVALGIKVNQNDGLPQEICAKCVSCVNEIMTFRKTCENNQLELEQYKLKTGQTFTSLDSVVKYETVETIDISFIEDQDTNFVNCNDLPSTCQDDSDSSDRLKKILKNPITIEAEFVEDGARRKSKRIQLSKEKNKKAKLKDTCEDNDNDIEEYDIHDKEDPDFKVKEESKTLDTDNELDEEIIPTDFCEVGNDFDGSNQSDSQNSDEGKEEIKCEHCPKILTSKSSLRNHLKIHTGFDFVCQHCGKRFITNSLLLMHCKAKHGYEKTDKCSYCDYTAANAEQVKIHERTHTGEKPFACEECSATFHRKSTYLQHVAIHLPEKTVKCPQCPAWFKSATLMRVHRAKHSSGSRAQYRCVACSACYARQHSALQHLERVHSLPPTPEYLQKVEKP